MRTQTKKRRKSRNFGYYVQEGLRGLLSHAFMSIAAIIIIAACLLITGSFSLVALNIQYNLEGLMAENEFLAYVDDTLTEEQARALQSQIESVPNVANVTFISAEEAKNWKIWGRTTTCTPVCPPRCCATAIPSAWMISTCCQKPSREL